MANSIASYVPFLKISGSTLQATQYKVFNCDAPNAPLTVTRRELSRYCPDVPDYILDTLPIVGIPDKKIVLLLRAGDERYLVWCDNSLQGWLDYEIDAKLANNYEPVNFYRMYRNNKPILALKQGVLYHAPVTPPSPTFWLVEREDIIGTNRQCLRLLYHSQADAERRFYSEIQHARYEHSGQGWLEGGDSKQNFYIYERLNALANHVYIYLEPLNLIGCPR